MRLSEKLHSSLPSLGVREGGADAQGEPRLAARGEKTGQQSVRLAPRDSLIQ